MSSWSGVSGVRYSVTLDKIMMVISCCNIEVYLYWKVQTYDDKAHRDTEHYLVRAQKMCGRRTRKHHCGSLAPSECQI